VNVKYMKQGAAVVAAVVALACSNRDATPDLSADLERAGTATVPTMQIVSAIEQLPQHQTQRAAAPRHTIVRQAAVAKRPDAIVASVPEPTSEAPAAPTVVAAPAPEPAPTAEPSVPAAEPAAMPDPRPAPIPVSAPSGRGGDDCGWREMACTGGGGRGGVVIRGGGVDGDHCDPRHGRDGHVAINQRFPMGGMGGMGGVRF
jgi:hypothetical protein